MLKLVHSSITQNEEQKRGKLSTNKEAIRAGVVAFKIKHNAKLDKQERDKQA